MNKKNIILLLLLGVLLWFVLSPQKDPYAQEPAPEDANPQPPTDASTGSGITTAAANATALAAYYATLGQPQPPTPPTAAATKFPLRQGSKGTEVRHLQVYLNLFNLRYKKGWPTLAEDGIWGGNTTNVIRLHTGKNTLSQGQYNALYQASKELIAAILKST